jgi:hypothetical protein
LGPLLVDLLAGVPGAAELPALPTLPPSGLLLSGFLPPPELFPPPTFTLTWLGSTDWAELTATMTGAMRFFPFLVLETFWLARVSEGPLFGEATTVRLVEAFLTFMLWRAWTLEMRSDSGLIQVNHIQVYPKPPFTRCRTQTYFSALFSSSSLICSALCTSMSFPSLTVAPPLATPNFPLK